MCEEHKGDEEGKIQRWYCTTCRDKLLCLKCLVDDAHFGHKIVEASNYLTTRIIRLNSIAKKLKKDIQEIDAKILNEERNINALNKGFNDLKSWIIETIDNRMMNPMIGEQKHILDKLKGYKERIVRNYEIFKREIDSMIKSSMNCIKDMDYTKLHSTIDIELRETTYDLITLNKKDLLSIKLNIDELSKFQVFKTAISDKVSQYVSSFKVSVRTSNNMSVIRLNSQLLSFYDFVNKNYFDLKVDNLNSDQDYYYTNTNEKYYIYTKLGKFSEFSFSTDNKMNDKKLADLLIRKVNFNLIAFGNYAIYLTGGEIDDRIQSSCEKYSIANDKWYKICPLNQGRSRHSLLVINQYIYCFGGTKEDTSKVERLDVLDEERKWVSYYRFSKEFSRYRMSSFLISPEELVLFGGFDDMERDAKKCNKINLYKDLAQYDENCLPQPSFFYRQPVIGLHTIYILRAKRDQNNHSFYRERENTCLKYDLLRKNWTLTELPYQ